MAALLILGLIMAVAVPSYLAFTEGARSRSTDASLAVMKNAINLYYMEQGQYPAKLKDLVEKPKTETKRWHQYLDKLPQDGWNFDFVYKVLPAGSKRPYELYSHGSASGPEGSPEERISVWG